MNLRILSTAFLAVLCIALAVFAFSEARENAKLRTENARERAAAVQARLHAAGYQITLGHVTGSLRETLAERDHWRALAEEPDATPVAYVSATAVTETHLEGDAREVSDDTARYEGEVTDNVFSLRWRLLLGHPPTFSADVSATVPMEFVSYRLPDGSLGVTAKSPDPRVRIEVEDFLWQPPPIKTGCGLGCKLRWAAGGIGLGIIGWEMIR